MCAPHWARTCRLKSPSPKPPPQKSIAWSPKSPQPKPFGPRGMDYSNAARSIQVQLQRNADGTASLRLSSTTPIQEPFVDLVLETQWSTGRLVRSYTLLLDPLPRNAMPRLRWRHHKSRLQPTHRLRLATTTPVQRHASAPPHRQPPQPLQPRLRLPLPAKQAHAFARAILPGRIADIPTVRRAFPSTKCSWPCCAATLMHLSTATSTAFVPVPSCRYPAAIKHWKPPKPRPAKSLQRKAVDIQCLSPQLGVESAAGRRTGCRPQLWRASASARRRNTPQRRTPDKLYLSKGSVTNAAAEAKVAEQKQASDQRQPPKLNWSATCQSSMTWPKTRQIQRPLTVAESTKPDAQRQSPQRRRMQPLQRLQLWKWPTPLLLPPVKPMPQPR